MHRQLVATVSSLAIASVLRRILIQIGQSLPAAQLFDFHNFGIATADQGFSRRIFIDRMFFEDSVSPQGDNKWTELKYRRPGW
jgi:hypothetical protein